MIDSEYSAVKSTIFVIIIAVIDQFIQKIRPNLDLKVSQEH